MGKNGFFEKFTQNSSRLFWVRGDGQLFCFRPFRRRLIVFSFSAACGSAADIPPSGSRRAGEKEKDPVNPVNPVKKNSLIIFNLHSSLVNPKVCGLYAPESKK